MPARAASRMVFVAFATALASCFAPPTARAGEADADFDDASRRLLTDEVFSDTPVEFALPADIAEIVNTPRRERARSARVSLLFGGPGQGRLRSARFGYPESGAGRSGSAGSFSGRD